MFVTADDTLPTFEGELPVWTSYENAEAFLKVARASIGVVAKIEFASQWRDLVWSLAACGCERVAVDPTPPLRLVG